MITDQYRLQELFIDSKSDVKSKLKEHREQLHVFYGSSLRPLDELSDEVDRAEFNRHNLEEQLDYFYQDVSGIKKGFDRCKTGC